MIQLISDILCTKKLWNNTIHYFSAKEGPPLAFIIPGQG